MATWRAIVTNTKTKKETIRYGSNCPPELVIYNATKAAEEETPAGDLPDRWDIVAELVREKDIPSGAK